VNDCVNAEVRDALPDLLHGRLSDLDTATMTAHVESCAACRAELAIMREAMDSLPIVPRMNAVTIAAAIPPYAGAGAVRSAPSRTPAWNPRLTVRLAVVAALVAIGGWAFSVTRVNDAVRQTAATSPVVMPEQIAPPAAAPLAVTSGEPSVATPEETQVASLSLVGSTADLTDADLEKLVAELDGMESLPAAEPQTITITDDDFGTSDENTDR